MTKRVARKKSKRPIDVFLLVLSVPIYPERYITLTQTSGVVAHRPTSVIVYDWNLGSFIGLLSSLFFVARVATVSKNAINERSLPIFVRSGRNWEVGIVRYVPFPTPLDSYTDELLN